MQYMYKPVLWITILVPVAHARWVGMGGGVIKQWDLWIKRLELTPFVQNVENKAAGIGFLRLLLSPLLFTCPSLEYDHFLLLYLLN